MKKTVLEELMKLRGEPCVSLILSTDTTSFTDRKEVKLKLKEARRKAEEKIRDRYPGETAEYLLNNIETLAQQVDFNHLAKGIGIFTTINYSRLIYFPLPVSDKMIIDNSFEIRDIITNLNKLIHYHVLLLSKNKIHLLRGNGIKLTEVAHAGFPRQYVEEFQLERTHPGSFYNKDESTIAQVRLADFLRETDHLLADYLDEYPLVLLGVERFLSMYKSISHHRKNIIGQIEGSYDRHTLHDLELLVWPVIEEYQEQKNKKLLQRVQEALGNHKAVSGIQEVWDVARLGLGNELIVEQDYATRAYHNPSNGQLTLGEPGKNDSEIPDAVEAVIDELLQYEGIPIHFVENDALKEHGRIVLITRY